MTLPVGFDCVACEDTGFVVRADGGAGTARRCECRLARQGDRLPRLLRAFGVPMEYAEASWETWEGRKPREAVAFQEEPSGTLYLWGLQGRGKTHLGTAVFRELVEGGARGAWRDGGRLVQTLRDLVREPEGWGYREELERLRRADVVLLDDFHRARTSFAIEALDEIVRARHADHLPLIVTANCSLSDLVRPFRDGGFERDPATASRLRGREVRLGGEDRRRKTVR